MKRARFSQVMLALFLILLGLVLLGVYAFGWEPRWFEGWWTLLLMAVAVVSMISNGIRYLNTFLLGGSFLVLAYVRGWYWMSSSETLFISLGAYAIILAGTQLMIRAFRPKRPGAGQIPRAGYSAEHIFDNGEANGAGVEPDAASRPNYTTVFSSRCFRNTSKNLQGGRATSVFGGIVIDLSQADFTQDIIFQVDTVFGGVDIYTPPGVLVNMSGSSVFGGCDTSGIQGRAYDPNHPKLTIRYNAVFGGLKIR
ncbi:MAG: cell wall-active antibiotics response protein [Oscillospiraceae bacterium]|nr:cell wall-active antibiotics response protein [Oscillospiraceae bacterium]